MTIEETRRRWFTNCEHDLRAKDAYVSRRALASALRISEGTLSRKLNGKLPVLERDRMIMRTVYEAAGYTMPIWPE